MTKSTVLERDPETGEERRHDMHTLDARHAVAADPERYELVKEHPVDPPKTFEQRISALEAWRASLEAEPAPVPDEGGK